MDWLDKIVGLIHVGANFGEERFVYADNNLSVIWFEALPDAYTVLCQNLKDSAFSKQIPVNQLITDRDYAPYTFHVSSNHGASSSIFEFGDHKKIWKNITMRGSLDLISMTLPTALNVYLAEKMFHCDGLVLDTQGSELLVLMGAFSLLKTFKFIQVEAADFQSYLGGCTSAQVRNFLEREECGFKLCDVRTTAGNSTVGFYYELLFVNSRI